MTPTKKFIQIYKFILLFLSARHCPFSNYHKVLSELYNLPEFTINNLSILYKISFLFFISLNFLFIKTIPFKNSLFISSFLYSLSLLFLSSLFNQTFNFSLNALKVSFSLLGIASSLLFASLSIQTFKSKKANFKKFEGFISGIYSAVFLSGSILAKELILTLYNFLFSSYYGTDGQSKSDFVHYIQFEALLFSVLILNFCVLLDYYKYSKDYNSTGVVSRIGFHNINNNNNNKGNNCKGKTNSKTYYNYFNLIKNKKNKATGKEEKGTLRKTFWVLSLTSSLFISAFCYYGSNISLYLNSRFEFHEFQWHLNIYLICVIFFSILSGYFLDVEKKNFSAFFLVRISVCLLFVGSVIHVLFQNFDMLYVTAFNSASIAIFLPSFFVTLRQRFHKESLGRFAAFSFLLAAFFFLLLSSISHYFYLYISVKDSGSQLGSQPGSQLGCQPGSKPGCQLGCQLGSQPGCQEKEKMYCVKNDCYKAGEILTSLYLAIALVSSFYMPRRKKVLLKKKLRRGFMGNEFTLKLLNKRKFETGQRLNISKGEFVERDEGLGFGEKGESTFGLGRNEVRIGFVDEFAEKVFRKRKRFGL